VGQRPRQPDAAGHHALPTAAGSRCSLPVLVPVPCTGFVAGSCRSPPGC
jgi:hypothetical protein